MNDLTGAGTLLEAALSHLSSNDRSLAAELHGQLAYISVARQDFGQAASHARLAEEQALLSGDRAQLADALAIRTSVGVLLGAGVDGAELLASLANEDIDRTGTYRLRASQLVGTAYQWIGALDESLAAFERLDQHLTEYGQESERPALLALIATSRLLAGDLFGAERVITECLRLCELTEQWLFAGRALTLRALILGGRGQFDAAHSDVDELRRIAAEASWSLGTSEALWVLGQLAITAGNAADAAKVLDPLIDAVQAFGVYEWPIAMAVPDAIEAYVAAGRVEEAEQLVHALGAWGFDHDRPWALATSARGQAMVHQARADLPAAAAAAERAVIEHKRLPMPFELGRTLLVLGQIQRRSGSRREARSTLSRAVSMFDGMGASAWADRARTELARIGVRGAPQGLTTNEHQVAELASTGLTNNEIALRMFISRRTVEATLARCYSKLGIGGRAGLGVALANERRSATS